MLALLKKCSYGSGLILKLHKKSKKKKNISILDAFLVNQKPHPKNFTRTPLFPGGGKK
jgi:hypothetical protein